MILIPAFDYDNPEEILLKMGEKFHREKDKFVLELHGQQVFVLAVGRDSQSLKEAVETGLKEQKLTALIGVGNAGALCRGDKHLGELFLVSSCVRDEKEPLLFNACSTLLHTMEQTAQAEGIFLSSGTMVEDKEVFIEEAKAAHWMLKYGAGAVDKESVTLAELAGEKKVPFMVVKGISYFPGAKAKTTYEKFRKEAGENALRGVLAALEEFLR